MDICSRCGREIRCIGYIYKDEKGEEADECFYCHFGIDEDDE